MPELYDILGGRTYSLDEVDEVYIGRSASEGHLKIDKKYTMVSRRHARVFRKEGRFFVEDLGSKFGTWFNDIKIVSPMALKNDSRIDLGDIRYYSITYREKKPEGAKKPEKPGKELKVSDDDPFSLDENEEKNDKFFDKFIKE